MSQIKSPADLDAFRKGILAKRDPETPCISICAGAGCIASGADKVIDAFENQIEAEGLKTQRGKFAIIK